NPELPTRYLYVANCTVGGTYGVGEQAILSAFGAFGSVTDVYSQDDKGYILVTFEEVAAAARAREAMSGRDDLSGRKLFVQFSDEAPPPSSLSTSLSCTSTTAQVVIPGLSIIEGFVSPAEEAALIRAVDAQPFEESIQRRVQHYGFAFRYDTRDVDIQSPLGPMPGFCTSVVATLAAVRPDIAPPNQITVNEYVAGQGIAPHVDTPGVFTEYIASLSLGCDIVMDFRLVSNPQIVKHVHLKRGSMCLMVGEARYLWKHGIAYRKHDLVQGIVLERGRRLSLTLRRVVLGGCDDVQTVESVQKPSAVELEHVHGVYDSIASHFSHTRHHPWPLVATFLGALAPGSLVADVGCGNGKYLGVNNQLMMIGSDRSIPLLTVCAKRAHEVFGCDGLAVPLRTGGQIYLVAWAFEQDELSKRKFESQDVMVEWKLQQKYIDVNEPVPAHVQMDNDRKWAVYQRYCHVYKDLELEMLVRQVPGLVVAKVEMMRSNWCLTIQRV
ncbi:hypothetical protein DYB37_003451, partial [Aphanomyces astaci]